MSKNKSHYEECLRKLMAPIRGKIESGKSYDENQVRRLLAEVSEYAEISQDMRFVDCITYYEELGVHMDVEES